MSVRFQWHVERRGSTADGAMWHAEVCEQEVCA